MATKLTAKQRMFALEYIICKNGTESARRAGYDGTDASLGQIAYENLRKLEIQAFIDERFAETAMRADEVIARISDTAAADMGDFISIKHGLPFFDLDKAQARNKLHLIKKFENTPKGVKLELHDAGAAQRTLAQHHGLLKSEVTISFAPEMLERFDTLAKQADVPASQLFEEMMNAIAVELSARREDDDSKR